MKTKVKDTSNLVNIPIDRKKVGDYHYKFSKGMSVEERDKNNIGDIWINGAVCLGCGDFIRSKNRHNFVTCSCGNLSVDGGSWYGRRVYDNKDSYIDVIEYFDNL